MKIFYIQKNTKTNYHFSQETSTLMWQTCAALIPGIIVLVFMQGSRWIGILITALLTAWCAESLALFLRARTKQIPKQLQNGSASLTAILLALCLPVSSPAWLVIIGVLLAVLIGKEVYGGLGMNPFNPAMVGFSFLLIGFPMLMSAHPSETLGLSSYFTHIDAQTAATLLDKTRQLRISQTSFADLFEGIDDLLSIILPLIAWGVGGIFLIYKKIIDKSIVFSVLISSFICASIFWICQADKFLNPFIQLASGALFFGAFFIATDPVTAATTAVGRIIFGSIIGILTICIRNLGNFPDGFAFAVLIANALVPLLDKIRPKFK